MKTNQKKSTKGKTTEKSIRKKDTEKISKKTAKNIKTFKKKAFIHSRFI